LERYFTKSIKFILMKCKQCKVEFTPVRFNQKYCLESDCVRVWVEVEKEKQWKKKKKMLKESCAKPLGAKYDAGHYFSMGGHKAVTFDEDNVHAQCVTCNQYKHGNLINYQIGIQQRIGAERLIELHAKAHEVKKWTKDELKEIIKRYKTRINEI